MQEKSRKALRWLGILLGTLVLSLATLSVFAWMYREEIISKTLDILRQELRVPVSYESVDVSIWTSFPLLSINFKQLEIFDPVSRESPLMDIEQFSLSFNWLDAWQGNYHVHQLKLKEGQINMCLDKRGNANWEIFKNRSTTTEDVSMRLEKVILKDVLWSYRDKRREYNQVVFWDNLQLKGDFTSMESKLSLNASGICEKLTTENREIIQNLSFECSGDVMYQRNNEVLTFEELEWVALDAPMEGKGWIDFKKEQCDIEVKAENVEVQEWVDNMPGWISEMLHSYEPAGNFQIQGLIKGSWNGPTVMASMKWKEGALKEPLSGVELEDVDFHLNYYLKNGHDVWTLDHLNATLAKGQWNIKGQVRNTLSPELDLDVEMHSGIQEVVDFLKWDSLFSATGQLDVKANVKGKWNPEDSLWRWDNWKAEGNVSLKAETFQWHTMPHAIQNVQALVQLHEDNAILHQCSAQYQHSDIDLTGNWHNAVNWLLNTSSGIEANVVLKSKHIQGEDFIQSQGAGFGLPAFSLLNLRCEVDEFAFHQFEAKKFRTNLTLREGLLKAEAFQWEMAEGKLEGDLEVFANEHSKRWEVDVNASIEKVNLPRLMVLFNDFGQSAIKSDQLKGRIDADVTMGFQLDADLKLDLSSVNGVVDMNVVSGEIIHWSVLEDVAGYLKKNKWIAPLVDEDLLAKKLSWVKFEELRNTISIANQVIEIPWMEIKSSALNMVFKASHSFNNDMDYLMGFHVRDLLLRDPNQGPIEEGKKFFISMKGPLNNLRFSVENDKEWKALFDDNTEQKDRSVKKWLDDKRDGLIQRRDAKKEMRNEQQSKRREERLENRISADQDRERNKRQSKKKVK